ncbi:MAG: flavodoxin family protein [Clostridia bacterium]|nr:flavodoxin family protein [Clostridia bacterium]
MKIAILNGSPRKANTAAMVDAFAQGAQEAGHEVEIIHVGKMNIGGCKGCEYCHTKGEGKCIQKDDMEKVIPAYLESDMIVFATPVYYFGMTAQMSAAIQRVYCIGKPAKAKKAALLVSSGSPDTGRGAIASYQDMLKYMGIEDAGVCALSGEENKNEEKLTAIKEFAKNL